MDRPVATCASRVLEGAKARGDTGGARHGGAATDGSPPLARDLQGLLRASCHRAVRRDEPRPVIGSCCSSDCGAAGDSPYRLCMISGPVKVLKRL